MAFGMGLACMECVVYLGEVVGVINRIRHFFDNTPGIEVVFNKRWADTFGPSMELYGTNDRDLSHLLAVHLGLSQVSINLEYVDH